jgi:hypothetical protein
MSQGFFRVVRTGDDGTIRRSKATAFGIAGSSLSAKRGRVYKVTFVNKGATAYFAQIHDKATAPIAGDVPIWEDKLAANASVTIFFDEGLFCALGIGLAISTTAELVTLAAANDGVAYAQYTATNP